LVAVLLLADVCVVFLAVIVSPSPVFYVLLRETRPLSSVLEQPEDVAVGISDGGHQAATTNVAYGVLHGGTGSGYLSELRLDVRHVPVGHRRSHALRSTARHQPDVLALRLEADVISVVGLRSYAEQGGVHLLGRREVGHRMKHNLDSLGGRVGHHHSLSRGSISHDGHARCGSLTRAFLFLIGLDPFLSWSSK